MSKPILTTKEREIVEASRGRDADTALVAIIDRLVVRAAILEECSEKIDCLSRGATRDQPKASAK
jgi:hypothetical protein